MFIFRLIFFLALSAVILGAKTGSASPSAPSLNPADVICGLPHGKDTSQNPTGDNAQAASFSEALWKGAVKYVKSHGSTCPIHPKSQGHGSDCPPNHAGFCCPTNSGESAINGKLADLFTQASYGSSGFLDTATISVSPQTLHQSHMIGPDPRPPAI